MIQICVSTGTRPWIYSPNQLVKFCEKTGADGLELLLTNKIFKRLHRDDPRDYYHCPGLDNKIKSLHAPYGEGGGSFKERLFTWSIQPWPLKGWNIYYLSKGQNFPLVGHLNDPRFVYLQNLNEHTANRQVHVEYRRGLGGHNAISFEYPEYFARFLEDNKLYCCLDVGYAAEAWPGYSLLQVFKILQKYTKVIHLHDVKFKGERLGTLDKNLILGKGILQRETSALAAHIKLYKNFKGHIVLELLPFYRNSQIRKMVRGVREMFNE